MTRDIAFSRRLVILNLKKNFMQIYQEYKIPETLSLI